MDYKKKLEDLHLPKKEITKKKNPMGLVRKVNIFVNVVKVTE